MPIEKAVGREGTEMILVSKSYVSVLQNTVF